jgi:hypothetical protein
MVGMVTLMLACSSPTMVCACPPSRGHAVVYGSVSDDAGPAGGALVQATIFGALCGGAMGEQVPYLAPLRASDAGTYRLHLHSVGGPGTSCVRLVGQDAEGARRVEIDAALRFRSEQESPDSLRVDLRLP